MAVSNESVVDDLYYKHTNVFDTITDAASCFNERLALSWGNKGGLLLEVANVYEY